MQSLNANRIPLKVLLRRSMWTGERLRGDVVHLAATDNYIVRWTSPCGLCPSRGECFHCFRPERARAGEGTTKRGTPRPMQMCATASASAMASALWPPAEAQDVRCELQVHCDGCWFRGRNCRKPTRWL